ncbi:zinc-ribbon domain-containing protein [Raoultibacter timonensis]
MMRCSVIKDQGGMMHFLLPVYILRVHTLRCAKASASMTKGGRMCFRPPSVDEGGESVCTSCGATNPSGSEVCTSCGKPLLKIPAAAMGRAGAPPAPGVPGAQGAPGVPKPPTAPRVPKP